MRIAFVIAVILGVAACRGGTFGPSEPGYSKEYCAAYPYAEACRR
jgi:hypothetical protein